MRSLLKVRLRKFSNQHNYKNMKKSYTSPRITEFGTVETLTQYGTGGGSSDIVYLANPAGVDAVAFLQGQGLSLADAQIAVAVQISQAAGGDPFGLALINLQGGAAGKGSSYNPTLGATFTP